MKIVESEDEALEIDNFLNLVRVEHNNNWKSPRGSNVYTMRIGYEVVIVVYFNFHIKL